AGAKMIPWVSGFASSLRSTVILATGITTLGFSIINSLKSVGELAKISFYALLEQGRKAIASYRDVENTWQFRNPVRFIIVIISTPFNFVAMGFHFNSMGDMGNRLGNLNPELVTDLNAASEFLTDFTFLSPHEGHSHGLDITKIFLIITLSPL